MTTVQEIAARIVRESRPAVLDEPTQPVKKTAKRWAPNRKVVSGAIAGLVSLGLAYLADYMGIALEPGGVATVTAFFTSAVAYLIPFSDK